ncbi:MAG: hypothetical protein ACSLEZ_03400 [Thiobacillus sp.]
MIVHEAHAFPGIQRIQRAENGGMAKALGNSARIEWVDLVLARMQMGAHESGS